MSADILSISAELMIFLSKTCFCCTLFRYLLNIGLNSFPLIASMSILLTYKWRLSKKTAISKAKEGIDECSSTSYKPMSSLLSIFLAAKRMESERFRQMIELLRSLYSSLIGEGMLKVVSLERRSAHVCCPLSQSEGVSTLAFKEVEFDKHTTKSLSEESIFGV